MVARTVVSTIVGGLSLFLDFSIGKAIAKTWDRYDTKRNNGLCDKLLVRSVYEKNGR